MLSPETQFIITRCLACMRDLGGAYAKLPAAVFPAAEARAAAAACMQQAAEIKALICDAPSTADGYCLKRCLDAQSKLNVSACLLHAAYNDVLFEYNPALWKHTTCRTARDIWEDSRREVQALAHLLPRDSAAEEATQ